jgi:hypothetical protein
LLLGDLLRCQYGLPTDFGACAAFLGFVSDGQDCRGIDTLLLSIGVAKKQRQRARCEQRQTERRRDSAWMRTERKHIKNWSKAIKQVKI